MRNNSAIGRTWQKFVLWVGQPASFLKRHSVLWWLHSLGVVAAVVIPVFMSGDDAAIQVGTGWIWAVGAYILVVNASDRLADAFDSKTADDSESALEDLATCQVSDLNSFIEQCCHVATLNGKSRQDHLDVLRKFLVIAASTTLGPGTRASYYRLEYAEDGSRNLVDPVHNLQLGRNDQSDRGFYESQEPDNSIWNMLDRADTEPQIVEHPENPDKIDWEKVAYKTYYSVPVKYHSNTFGFLSVNCKELGSISESQRQAILGMARAYALTLMLAKKQR